MCLIDGNLKCSADGKYYYSINYTPIECVVIGYNTDTLYMSSSTSSSYSIYPYLPFSYLYDLKFVKNYNKTGIYIICANIELNILDGKVYCISNCSCKTPIDLNTTHTTQIGLNYVGKILNPLYIYGESTYSGILFNSCNIDDITEIHFPELVSTDNIEITFHSGGVPNYSIKKIVFSDNFKSEIKVLNNESLLGVEELIIPNNYKHDLNMRYGYKLKKTNIVDIFNKLSDLTNDTTLIVTLSRRIKLTDEELAIATNKNWTVTFA